MNQNSFQKNPFINNNSNTTIKNNKFSSYDKLGRKTVEEVKQEMVDVKYSNFKESLNRKTEVEPPKQQNNIPNFQNRVNNLRNINRG